MRARRSTGRARYRVIDGKSSVELKLRTPRQLFDERDPAPFRERDLDDDAARYILQSFRELRDHNDVNLKLYFDTLDELKDKPQVIGEAIHAFFNFERDVKRRELRDIFRIGLISLLIGLSFLFACTLIYHGIFNLPWLPGPIGLMLKEGALIMGYVSMWKPLSIFLYEWWPLRAELHELRDLGEIEIEVLALDKTLIWSSAAQQGPIDQKNMRPIDPLKATSAI
jgi:hypothetical protein